MNFLLFLPGADCPGPVICLGCGAGADVAQALSLRSIATPAVARLLACVLDKSGQVSEPVR